MQDRLGLVVASVAHGDEIGIAPRRHFQEPGVPRLAGVGLEVIRPGRRPGPQLERKAQGRGQVGDERGVFAGFLAPSAVIEMGDDEGVIPGRFLQEAEQAHAVRPARDGHDDAMALEAPQGGAEASGQG